MTSVKRGTKNLHYLHCVYVFQGAYAFVEFQSPDAVEKAISLENLSLGDKQITVKVRAVGFWIIHNL